MNIKEYVHNIKLKYNTSDPVELTKEFNIILYKTSLHSDIKGFYKKFYSTKTICLNDNMPEYEEKFVCAHELGHALLSHDLTFHYLGNCNIGKLEYKADVFAAELLLSDDIFEKYSGYSNAQIGICEGIPERLVEIKGKNLDKF